MYSQFYHLETAGAAIQRHETATRNRGVDRNRMSSTCWSGAFSSQIWLTLTWRVDSRQAQNTSLACDREDWHEEYSVQDAETAIGFCTLAGVDLHYFRLWDCSFSGACGHDTKTDYERSIRGTDARADTTNTDYERSIRGTGAGR